MNREKILENLNATNNALSGTNGAEQALNVSLKSLSRIENSAPSKITPIIKSIDSILASIEDIGININAIADDFSLSEESLESVDDRLYKIRGIAKKHQVDSICLPKVLEDIKQKLALLENNEDALQKITNECANAYQNYLEKAKELSSKRTTVATKLDKAINAELEPLKLGKAKFKTEIKSKNENEYNDSGVDKIVFLVATNVGGDFAPLNKIASGGELARFMLAIKVVLNASNIVPVLVFDELDTGISGATSSAVGERLVKLGKEAQTLVITHSPQVAAKGEIHLQISKQIANNTTTTVVRALSATERVEEIARMLSGDKITDEARAVAIKLMEGKNGSL